MWVSQCKKMRINSEEKLIICSLTHKSEKICRISYADYLSSFWINKKSLYLALKARIMWIEMKP